jgi:hypothetical protein
VNSKFIDVNLIREWVQIDESIPQRLRWIKRPSNRVKVGDPVGNKCKRKNLTYYEFSLLNTAYLNHRVYYALKTNKDPGDLEIDHSDHDYENTGKLRLATRSQQAANQRPRGLKKYKGVHHDKRDGRFYARIRVNYKRISLGGYLTEEEAAFAYNEAALKYFGEFAYLNVIQHKSSHQPELHPNQPF